MSRTRLFRPRQIFHEMLTGIASQILGWAPPGTGRWYKEYGRTILIGFVRIQIGPQNALLANYHPKLAAWAIIMTELELYLNGQAKNLNGQWGFGQVRMAIASFTKIRLNHIS